MAQTDERKPASLNGVSHFCGGGIQYKGVVYLTTFVVWFDN